MTNQTIADYSLSVISTIKTPSRLRKACLELVSNIFLIAGAGHELGRFRKDNVRNAYTCDIVESDARQRDSSGQAATEEVAAGAPTEYE